MASRRNPNVCPACGYMDGAHAPTCKFYSGPPSYIGHRPMLGGYPAQTPAPATIPTAPVVHEASDEDLVALFEATLTAAACSRAVAVMSSYEDEQLPDEVREADVHNEWAIAWANTTPGDLKPRNVSLRDKVSLPTPTGEVIRYALNGNLVAEACVDPRFDVSDFAMEQDGDGQPVFESRRAASPYTDHEFEDTDNYTEDYKLTYVDVTPWHVFEEIERKRERGGIDRHQQPIDRWDIARTAWAAAGYANDVQVHLPVMLARGIRYIS